MIFDLFCILAVMFGGVIAVSLATGLAAFLRRIPWWVWLLLIGFLVGLANRP